MEEQRVKRVSIKTRVSSQFIYRPKVRKITGHKCDLRLCDDQVQVMISEGIFVDMRRKFRRWLTASPTNYYSKKYLKSSAEIEKETMIHWTSNYYMIHPFSDARFVWEMLMISVYFLYFFSIPVEMSVNFVSPVRFYLRLILDIITVVDIILWFVTGYYDTLKQTVVLDFQKVAKHYIIWHFFWDVISIVPIVEIQYLTKRSDLYTYKLFLLFKITRLKTLTDYLTKFGQRVQRVKGFINGVHFIVWYSVVILWTTCMIFLLTNSTISVDYNCELDVLLAPMIVSGYGVIKTLMEVGVGRVSNPSTWKLLGDVVTLGVGSAFTIVILAKVMNIFQTKTSTQSKYENFIAQVGEYMKYKELSTSLRQKVLRYVNFKFQKNIFKEDDIMNTISSALKEDILQQICQRMIEKVDFFKDMPHHVMRRIVTRLKSEIYLAGDTIIMAGYSGTAMYFIYIGSVAVYTSTGTEICHLEDGEHFGEISLLVNQPRVATVVAIKDCEVFRLNRKDFQDAIQPFPELKSKMEQMALERLKATMKMTENLPGSLEESDNKAVRFSYTNIQDFTMDKDDETSAI